MYQYKLVVSDDFFLCVCVVGGVGGGGVAMVETENKKSSNFPFLTTHETRDIYGKLTLMIREFRTKVAMLYRIGLPSNAATPLALFVRKELLYYCSMIAVFIKQSYTVAIFVGFLRIELIE